MRILAVHNRYLIGGGEDISHATEVSLLRSQGHIVDELIEDNQQIAQLGLFRTSLNTIWSHKSYKKVKEILNKNHYDLMVVQNFFPLLSPSIFFAAKSLKIPVILFLRNYRLFCLNGFAFRNHRPCIDCLQKPFPWPGIYHACYRQSRPGSTVVATMLFVHHLMSTWQRNISAFVTLSSFANELLRKASLPREKLFIKPNFVHPDPGVGSGSGKYFLYVGRLSPEKGIRILLEAWQKLNVSVNLKLIGEGPLKSEVIEAARLNPTIEFLGKLSQEQVFQIMKDAEMLVFPSIWYEGMPRTIIESFSVGTPVLTSEIGSIKEMIVHGKNGFFFRQKDSSDLAIQVEYFAKSKNELRLMRDHARQSYENNYTLQKNLETWQIILNNVLDKLPQ